MTRKTGGGRLQKPGAKPGESPPNTMQNTEEKNTESSEDEAITANDPGEQAIAVVAEPEVAEEPEETPDEESRSETVQEPVDPEPEREMMGFDPDTLDFSTPPLPGSKPVPMMTLEEIQRATSGTRPKPPVEEPPSEEPMADEEPETEPETEPAE